MALGGVTATTRTSGRVARVSAALVARTMILIGCALRGTAAAIYRPQTDTAAEVALGGGELHEAGALIRSVEGAPPPYLVVAEPTTAGAVSSVAHQGSGAGTLSVSVAPHVPILVKCTKGGALGTAEFAFSTDGGQTWSDPVTSTASSYSVRVPNTYCVLDFASATYVVDKTLTVSVDGTVTPGDDWVGTVTQASSPVDYYELRVTVLKGGALGVVRVRVSLDDGRTTLFDDVVPSGGKRVIAGTGIVLTFASTFVEGDVYTALAVPPAPTSQDIDDCLDAIRADNTIRAKFVHSISLPSDAAAAMAQAVQLNAAVSAAKAQTPHAHDWQAACECPVVGDLILDGASAIIDVDDDDATIRGEREGLDLKLTAVHGGTHVLPSALTARQPRRPTGWGVLMRKAGVDPCIDPARVANGPLPFAGNGIGRDEAQATVGLDDVQINTIQRRRRPGAFLSITESGYGWKNLTVDADFQWATGVQVLNIGLEFLREELEIYIGETPLTNPDGTIAETVRRAWSTEIDTALKRFYGLLPGGDFNTPQVSFASAEVLASSQLGAVPHRLDVQYRIQPRGFISSVAADVLFTGVLTVTSGS